MVHKKDPEMIALLLTHTHGLVYKMHQIHILLLNDSATLTLLLTSGTQVEHAKSQIFFLLLGHFERNIMSFGLHNVSAMSQHLMDHILASMQCTLMTWQRF